MKQIKPFAVFILLAMILSYVSPFAVSDIKTKCFTASEKISAEIKEKTVMLCEGDYVLFGRYLGEPILWRVVETDGKVLIVSEKILCFKAFDACGKNGNFHTSRESVLFGSGKWEESTLNQWLNSDETEVTFSHCPPVKDSVFKGGNSYEDEAGFLCDDNFTHKEKELISGEGVFLPERKMLEKYFDKADLQKECTAEAILTNESPYFLSYSRNVWYWTSSPVSYNDTGVVTVTSSGRFYKSLAYDSGTGVCPALYLTEKSVLCRDGNGTIEKPYKISGGKYEN